MSENRTTMGLKPDFHFSQNNLQDYLDCPRRFELRYIQRLEWPALDSEPVIEQEQRIEAGRQFHQMVQQYVAGIEAEQIRETLPDTDVSHWWDNFLQAEPLASLPSSRWAEIYLSAPLAGYRIAAQFDLIAIEPGKRAVIVDWKTSARKPARNALKTRLQTRVYRYLLVAAGAYLNGGQILAPEQVEMVYWFAEAPSEPETFKYNEKMYVEDKAHLEELIQEIAQHEPGRFTLTPDVKKCLFCNFRSLCDRGEKAGSASDQEDEQEAAVFPDTDQGFEQIGEIEF
ncbi:MAG TPA: PD-(D/E)XK nuclease family protein [Anaerolineaceae bacterium]|nr:PD-(D/E)XK nuclease family protein [Anaerolineaceae bacterium]